MQWNPQLFLQGPNLSDKSPWFCWTKTSNDAAGTAVKTNSWQTFKNKIIFITKQSLDVTWKWEAQRTISSMSAAHRKAGGNTLCTKLKNHECFLPLSGHFLCSLCIKAVTGCFSHADCLRQMSKWRGREEMPPQTGWVSIQSIFFLSISEKGWDMGSELKKPAHIKTNPVDSVVAVESGHELGINLSLLNCSSQTESSVCTNQSWIWHLLMKDILSKQHTAKETRRVPCFPDTNRLWEVSTAKHSC